MQSTIDAYEAAVKKHFHQLKAIQTREHLQSNAIFLEAHNGYLLPICQLHLNDEALIATLAQWRSDNSFAYPSQFPVTHAGTKMWLKDKLLNVEDRILFLVFNSKNEIVGHLGYANGLNNGGDLEIDNVVRGVKEGNGGIMQSAMRSLLGWAQNTLHPPSIFLRVLSDNAHAIHFYQKLGFVESGRIPLRRHTESSGIFYRPVEAGDSNDPDRYFIRMNYVAPS